MSTTDYKFTTSSFKIPPRSKALIHELQLKEVFERHPNSPSRERAMETFRIFGELIQEVGAYSVVLTTIKDELFRSVYSKDLTSKNVEPFLERVPYFKAVGKLESIRKVEIDKLLEKDKDIQSKLRIREQELQLAYKKSLFLKEDLYVRDKKIKEFQEKLDELESITKVADSEKEKLRLIHYQREKELEHKGETLQISLGQANQIIEKLSVFKTSYVEDPDEAIRDLSRLKKVTLEMTASSMIEYDIAQGEKLKLQFCEMLDFQLDDFENSISQLQKKKEILSMVATQTEERDIAHALELREINAGFRKRVDDLLQEKTLLENHLIELKRSLTKSKGKELLLVKRTDDEGKRRYGVKLLISTDKGKTFSVYRDANFCSKCGERTVSCPHQLKDFVVPIHINVTHIKFQHLNLRFNSNHIKAEYEEEKEIDMEVEKLRMDKTFFMIYEEFHETRKAKTPRLMRTFPIQKLLIFFQEFYSERWKYELDLDEDECFKRGKMLKFKVTFFFVKSIKEFFYSFMENRYQIKNLYMKPVYDIISSLQVHHKRNYKIKLFAMHLSGEHDAAWKYFLLVEKLMSHLEPFDIKQYRTMLQILYPSRTKEVYEQLELEFIAFSSNKITKESIEDHLLYMLLSKIEPNYSFFLKCMKKIDIQLVESLTYDEFDEAIVHILPVVSAVLKKTRYCITAADFFPKNPSLERLAYTATFIALQSCYENNWHPQTLITGEFQEWVRQDQGGVGGAKEGVVEKNKENDENEKKVGGAGGGGEIFNNDHELLEREVNSILVEGSVAGKVFNEQEIQEESLKFARRVKIMSKKEAGELRVNDDADSDGETNEIINRHRYPE